VAPPVVEALQRNAHQKDYLPVKGLRALRESVAAYYERRQGVARSPDDVLVGPGSKELMFLIQLAYYGDLVIPTPSWVSYAPQAQIIGRHVRWLPTLARNSLKLQPGELESLCADDAERPRLLILNYPNNPVGGTYSESELRALADVARRYRVVMLSDEIYGEIHHRGEHVSIAHFYPEGTIVSSGLSKWCGAGGWRLGTFTFPPGLRWLLDGMAAVASETFTSTSAPIQHAAVRAFEGGEEIESYLGHSRRVLSSLGCLCAERLREAGAAVEPPEGAFYLFPDFKRLRSGLRARGIATSTELCRRLLEETGVATLPGSHFGRPPSELTLRLAYVDFDGAAALAAAERLSGELAPEFPMEHCGRVVEAIDRMTRWLGG
jgi:aspartate aminotransferase